MYVALCVYVKVFVVSMDVKSTISDINKTIVAGKDGGTRTHTHTHSHTHTHKSKIAGKESRPLAPSSIGVMGTFTAIGRPVSQAWSELVTTAYDGDTHLIVEGILNWSVGCEVVVTPTDLDPHEVGFECVLYESVHVCLCIYRARTCEYAKTSDI